MWFKILIAWWCRMYIQLTQCLNVLGFHMWAWTKIIINNLLDANLNTHRYHIIIEEYKIKCNTRNFLKEVCYQDTNIKIVTRGHHWYYFSQRHIYQCMWPLDSWHSFLGTKINKYSNSTNQIQLKAQELD